MSEASTLSLNLSETDREYLLSTQAIRDRCRQVLKASDAGKSLFLVDRTRYQELANYVAEVTQKNYPDLKVPFHSRWKHFDVGQIPRLKNLENKIAGLSLLERLKVKTDLVITSVLVDAGAGMKWSFKDPEHNFSCGKSEGLALASLYAFMRGAFSSNPKNPLQVDALGLENLSWEQFQKDFQITPENPMDGDRGRFELLKNLGKTLKTQTEFFGNEARLGNLCSTWEQIAHDPGSLPATAILRSLQDSLGSIWPGRISVDGYNLGDVWPCPALGTGKDALVPFHKLSQWLSYSLIDPIMEAGIPVKNITDLTGLAEYRNGGLLIDFGVLKLRHPGDLKKIHKTSDPFIVEWRALTLAVIDEWAPIFRKKLNVTESNLPLGKVLEAGTWWAGRKIAAERRKDGSSPVQIASDGTVF